MNNELSNYRKISYPGVKKNSYLISEEGNVYSLLSDKILKPYNDKDGYLKIKLIGNINKSKTIFIHRLVAYQFVNNPNDFPVVDHIDGNKTNNHYTNLEWVSIKENTLHAERLGLRKIKGEDNGNNKYSEEFIRVICEYFELGLSIKDVYRKFKGKFARVEDDQAYYMMLTRIKQKKLWPDIVNEYSYSIITKSDHKWYAKPNDNSLFSEAEIHYICQLLEKGYTVIDILENLIGSRDYKMYKNKYEAINCIRNRENWDYITSQYKYTLKDTTSRLPIKDSEFYILASQGYDVKEIMKIYNLKFKKDNPSLYEKIRRAYNKYHKIKDLSDNENIKIIA